MDPVANSPSYDIELSPDQLDAVDRVLEWYGRASDDSFIFDPPVPRRFTLGGYAGSGKTTIVKYIVGAIHGSVAVCAFTGKAAYVLRQKGVPACTMHRLIYDPVASCEGCGMAAEDFVNNPGHWCPHKAVSVQFVRKVALPYALVVVDEASMVSRELMEDLESFGVPVLYVGDHGQLEPIGDNPGLMVNPDIRLEQIHRQAEGSEILALATMVRLGHAPETTGPKATVVRAGTMPRDAPEYDTVLCGFNKDRVAVNQWIRGKHGRTGPGPVVGDRVVCLRNNHDLGIFNGMLANVLDVRTDTRGGHRIPVMDVEDDLGEQWNSLAYAPEQFGAEATMRELPKRKTLWDFGYALTTHKCVTGNTLVQTSAGWQRMDEVSEDDGIVATVDGPKEYSRRVVRPDGPVLKFLCEQGYGVTTTPDHRMRTFVSGEWIWKPASDLRTGDFLRLRLRASAPRLRTRVQLPPCPNANVRAKAVTIPETMSDNLAEFFGLMVADGTLYDGGFRLAKRYPGVVDRYAHLGEHLFGLRHHRYEIAGTPCAEFNSSVVASWLRRVGGMAPNQKSIPAVIMSAPLSLRARFLRGLFEDGTVNVKGNIVDHVEWANVSDELVRLVQILLLEYGIISSAAQRERISSLYIYADGLDLFREQIGFVSMEKNDRLQMRFAARPGQRYRVPVPHGHKISDPNVQQRGYFSRASVRDARDAGLTDLLAFHYVRIRSIERGRAPTFCFEVPGTGSFLQNGFDGSNSQGSQWKRVLVLEQISPKWTASRWRYTAVTRAEDELVYCVNDRRRR